MDWRPVLIGTAASASFMGLSLAGAFAIIGGAPPDQPSPRLIRERPVPSAYSSLPSETGAKRPDEPPVRSETAFPSGALAERSGAPVVIAGSPGRPATASGPAGRPAAARPIPHREAAPAHHLGRDVPPTRGSGTIVQVTRSEIRPRSQAFAEPAAPARLGSRMAEGQVQGMVTPSQLRRFHASLRLAPEQEPLWTPVEQALRQIGLQQAAMSRAGQDPREAFGFTTAMRVYAVARPFLTALREDQKAQVRAQALRMGFGSVAAQI